MPHDLGRRWAQLNKLARLLSTSQYRRALLRGVAAATEHEQVLQSLELATIIDVGANVGQFSLAARHAQPAANIIAVEPLPEAAKKFNLIFRGDDAAMLYEVAAGCGSGTQTIHVSAHADSSSLLPISALQNAAFPGTAEKAERVITVARLDELVSPEHVRRPILLKLDVQGFELEALKGAAGILHLVDWIYAEVSFREFYEGQPRAHEVFAWLFERGFALAEISTLSRDRGGAPAQCDALFHRQ